MSACDKPNFRAPMQPASSWSKHAVTDRDTLLKAILRSLARGYAGWLREPDALPPAYRTVCGTLGREVRIELPGGAVATGVATDVDVSGGLVVNGVAYGAGDVVHVR